jgi:RNA polymerase sigma factor (sigma-70 family)
MPGTQEASDERLLAAYCDGDLAAFEALFRRYQGPLCRHLTHMLNDHTTAEDLVIETFARLHTHRARFRAGAVVRPWVYTIANNLARNHHRRERLARWLPLAVVDAALPATVPPPMQPDVQRRVTTAFAALPERQRQVCSLRLLGELSLEEIARVIGASVGTVKSRLFYGQRRLRDLLADLDPEEGPR